MNATARAAVLAGAVTLLAGCTEYLDRRETVSFGAGNAQQSNLITHVVTPLPSHAADRDLLFEGDRAGSAVERYRTVGNPGEVIGQAAEEAAQRHTLAEVPNPDR